MQNYTEVVYLKNGSIIKGIVLEQIPDLSLKIQTADGSIFVYQMHEVDKITKENLSLGESSDGQRTSLQRLGKMRRCGRDLWLDDRELSCSEVKELVGQIDYGTFCNARRQIGWGRAFTIVFFVALGLTVIFSILHYLNSDKEALLISNTFFVVTIISLILMIILKSVGKSRINWVAKVYNNNVF